VSRARRHALAAYRALIEAAPAGPIDAIDNRLAAYKAGRLSSRELKRIDDWARRVRPGTKWYATDGSHRFYYFRKKMMCFQPGYHAFWRIACTWAGDDAASAYARHRGQLTDRRPSGWISAATLAGVRYGGLDGGPRDWGWRDNEDVDFDLRQCERLRAQDPSPFIRGSLHEYGEHLERAMAGAR
jgi:hypothetical protein